MPVITLSEQATLHLKSLIAETGRTQVLRVAFLYGCGGAGFRLSLETEALPEDILLQLGPLTVALDPVAASELEGAEIRCGEGEDGLELTLDHPNAMGVPLCGW